MFNSVSEISKAFNKLVQMKAQGLTIKAKVLRSVFSSVFPDLESEERPVRRLEIKSDFYEVEKSSLAFLSFAAILQSDAKHSSSLSETFNFEIKPDELNPHSLVLEISTKDKISGMKRQLELFESFSEIMNIFWFTCGDNLENLEGHAYYLLQGVHGDQMSKQLFNHYKLVADKLLSSHYPKPLIDSDLKSYEIAAMTELLAVHWPNHENDLLNIQNNEIEELLEV